MIEVYAALMLHEAKKEITEENIKKVLSSLDINVDEAKIKVLVSALQNINIDEAIKSAAILPQTIAQPEKKEEEKKEEKKEVDVSAGLAALFG
ncbi:MAG: 50S ribosomal protein L12 [Candidatus Aenigmatarchaeota archaeon]